MYVFGLRIFNYTHTYIYIHIIMKLYCIHLGYGKKLSSHIVIVPRSFQLWAVYSTIGQSATLQLRNSLNGAFCLLHQISTCDSYTTPPLACFQCELRYLEDFLFECLFYVRPSDFCSLYVYGQTCHWCINHDTVPGLYSELIIRFYTTTSIKDLVKVFTYYLWLRSM